MLRKVYMIECDRCAAVSPVIVADVFREALLRAHTVRFYIVDLGLRLCHDCAVQTGAIVPCQGDAHSNANIDHCPLCGPTWGWVKVK